MKLSPLLLASLCVFALLCPAAAQQATTPGPNAKPKLTCCQQAKTKGKECNNKCCVAAHKRKESCKRCNPNGEDMPKPAKKTEAAARKP